MRPRPNRYDHLDRRVQKITPAATHTYFYDGWMLIKEIVANTNGTTDVIEYHWGKDLSGAIGGAGGVGGAGNAPLAKRSGCLSEANPQG